MQTTQEQIDGDVKELRDMAEYFDSCGKKSNGDFLREIAHKLEIIWGAYQTSKQTAKQPVNGEMLVALKEALVLIRQYTEECGPCDHSVNICVCGLVSQAETWQEIIEKAEAAK